MFRDIIGLVWRYGQGKFRDRVRIWARVYRVWVRVVYMFGVMVYG